MDYKNIHDLFIKYFKTTSIRDRMLKRNPNDYRIYEDYIYSEIHHIIPRSQGGDNSPENLVRLLPEEHLFIHFLRFKAFKCLGDLQAVKICLNGFKYKTKRFNLNDKMLTKHIRIMYSFHRQECQKNRKINGWHTLKGTKSISEARKGKMPVMDANTGEKIGSVRTNHPKVLSGEWVHITKGKITVIEKESGKKVRVTSQEYKENKNIYSSMNNEKGVNNFNYSGVTDEEIIKHSLSFKEKYNIIPSYKLLVLYCKTNNIKIPQHLKKDFRFVEYGGGVEGYEKIVSQYGQPLSYHNNRKLYVKILKEIKNAKNN